MNPDDPWLPARIRGRALIARAEHHTIDAVTSAFTEYLAAVRAAVLGTTVDVTAAAEPFDLPPNLDAWPAPPVWEKLIAYIVAAAQEAWIAGWEDQLDLPEGFEVDSGDYIVDYLSDTTARLTGASWPDSVYDAVRLEVVDGYDQGRSIDELRARIADVLQVERWLGDAMVIARTETMAGLNGGAYQAGMARQAVEGEALHKQWIAVGDVRTRDAHLAANGLVVRANERFLIGGEPMRHPHDPYASAANTVQCRCVLNWLDDEEADEQRDLYARLSPAYTNADGDLVVAAARKATDLNEGQENMPGNIPAAAATGTDPDQQQQNESGGGGATTAAAVTVANGQSWAERVAASVPTEPPAEWFTNPELTGPTKVRVTDDGRVYGHIASWVTAHASIPGVYPPRHGNDLAYARFHRHPIRTADGERVKTGPLATGGHADLDAEGLGAVISHYDDPTFVAADVVAGEDDHGIWFSGALRPGIAPFQVMLLDRYSLSGDWRDGELVAACSVSVPGFHLDDDQAAIALAASAGPGKPRLADGNTRETKTGDGFQTALIAAGVVDPAPPPAIDGWRLYRDFQAAAAADQRVIAAWRRINGPAVTAAAARIQQGSGS